MGEERSKCVVMLAWCTRFVDTEKWHDLQTSLQLFIFPMDTKVSVLLWLSWTNHRHLLIGTYELFLYLCMYNTNEFRTKTMYDYYIAMKSMFFVVKLSSHSSISYASLTILLPWTTHKQHQNYSKPKAFQNQNFKSHKLCIHTITLYKWRCPSRSQNSSLNTNEKEINQETS
jgi:hypothetical protein